MIACHAWVPGDLIMFYLPVASESFEGLLGAADYYVCFRQDFSFSPFDSYSFGCDRVLDKYNLNNKRQLGCAIVWF